MKLKTVTLRGYKSIANLEAFELRNLNVLIGANGAGKSNFIGIFKLLAALADGNLQTFVQKQGGPDALLHGSRKRTQQIDAEIYFEPGYQGISNGYRISLTPTADNRLIFSRAETWIDGQLAGGLYCVGIGRAVFGESMFAMRPDASKIALAALVAFCRAHRVDMIDCQQNTSHLASLGAHGVPRGDFLTRLGEARGHDDPIWRFDPVYWSELLPAPPLDTT